MRYSHSHSHTHTHTQKQKYILLYNTRTHTHTTTLDPFVRITSGAAPSPLVDDVAVLVVVVVVVDVDAVVIILYLCPLDGGCVNQPFPHNIWNVFHRAYAGLYYAIYVADEGCASLFHREH